MIYRFTEPIKTDFVGFGAEIGHSLGFLCTGGLFSIVCLFSAVFLGFPTDCGDFDVDQDIYSCKIMCFLVIL